MFDKKQAIVEYILAFLLDLEDASDVISYSKDVSDKTPVTIIDSGFFDLNIYLTENSMPQNPLLEWHGIPLLFGIPKEEFKDGHLIIYADIIASTFFLVTRYEELINLNNKDIYGRFSGDNSLPGRAGFLERPVVDEYGAQLNQILSHYDIIRENVKKNMKEKGMVYLTHDVDIPWKKWSIKTAVRTMASWVIRQHEFHIWPLRHLLGDYRYNPYDTFDWMLAKDAAVKQSLGHRCEDIYFVIGADRPDEYTESYILDNKFQGLLEQLKKKASRIGLHISYDASDLESMQTEKKCLETKVNQKIQYNRNHYLRSISLEEFRNLIKIGITDDFTMGYADRVGFRLGTSRCINWIDPETMEITPLKLHPLIIMEGTLVGYMKLGEDESYALILKMWEIVKKYCGDFTILFHNSSFKVGGCDWMVSLYNKTLELIING